MKIFALIAALFFSFAVPSLAAHEASCYKQAKEKGLKGDERKAFLKECKASRKAEHDKMHEGKEKMHKGKEQMHEKEMEGMGKDDKPAAPAQPAEPKK